MEEKLLIDSIIFDVDGTLWDSTDVVADAWNQIMEKETDMTPNLTGTVLKRPVRPPAPGYRRRHFPRISKGAPVRTDRGMLCQRA